MNDMTPIPHNDQLKMLLRDPCLIDARRLNKVSGHPFRITEIEAAVREMVT